MKVYNYMMIMLVMMIFFSLIGINPGEPSNTLNSDIGVNINTTTGEVIQADVSNSGWFNEIFNATNGLIVAAGLGVAVIVGLYTRQFDWKLAISGFFTVFVLKFVSFGVAIVSIAKDTGANWLTAIVVTIFVPLTAMFIFSVVEWFGGTPSD